jgi:hypothetical protein
MNWRENCRKYWKKYTNNLTESFCNQGSFVMAIRLKYGVDLDETTHHWNREDVDEKIEEHRLKDVREYERECKLITSRGKPT